MAVLFIQKENRVIDPQGYLEMKMESMERRKRKRKVSMLFVIQMNFVYICDYSCSAFDKTQQKRYIFY